MGEVSRVQGPGGPQEPRKDKAVADSQKFKDLMKVQKIGEVDEEQKKKRKRKEEAEADTEADSDQVAAEAAGTQKGPSPLTPLQGKPSMGAPMKADAPPPAQAPAPAQPAPAVPEENDSFMEDESFMKTLPPAPPEDLDVAAPESKGPAKAEEAQAKGVRKAKDREASVQKKEIREKEKELRKEKEALSKEDLISRKEEKETFFKEMKDREKERAKEAEAVEEAAATTASPYSKEIKGVEKREKKVEEAGAVSTPTPATTPGEIPGAVPSSPTTGPSSYAYLHPLVLDLFERMVGVMTVMATTGITETTVTLSAPEYAKSVFYGAQIIITEFSTAPKAFNVQVIASPQGVALFQANVDDLVSAFQGGKYNFRINRIEAGLSAEKPLFKRKEGPGQDKEREQQQR